MSDAKGDDVRRDRLAALLMAPLLVAVAVAVVRSRWHSATSVDNRTYLEMIRAVAEHGLPYFSNGPVVEFRDMQARWNVVQDGRLWGAYPPVYPYLVAPLFRLGGAVAVVRFNAALLGALALGCFALGRRVARDPLAGVAAAYVAVPPVVTLAFDTSPYVFSITALAWAACFAAAATDAGARAGRREALACGLLCGLSAGAHLLGFSMLAGLVGALSLLRAEGEDPLEAARALVPGAWAARVEPWLPSAGSLARGACALGGVAVVMLPIGALNHLRFHSWNPISYGPCVWRSCVETGISEQTIGAMLRFVGPVLKWAAVSGACVWLVRRSRVGVATAAAVALAALVPESTLHERALKVIGLAWGFVVDVSGLPMAGFPRPPDGLGNFLGPFAVKSTLQCTPLLLVALLAPFATARDRRMAALLGLPCAGLYASLALRASMPTAYAFGFPFLYLRYVLPAVPLLAVLAASALRALPWSRAHLAAGAALALALGAWLLRVGDDGPYARRFFLLRGTLMLAAAAFLLAARSRVDARAAWRHAAAGAAAAALAAGLAVSLGVDLKAVWDLRVGLDRLVDDVARSTPRRFALVGWAGEIDPILALRATRDVEYLDLYESTNWGNFRALIDRWTAEGRPIFAVFPPAANVRSPWPDVRFEPVLPARGLVRVRKL